MTSTDKPKPLEAIKDLLQDLTKANDPEISKRATVALMQLQEMNELLGNRDESTRLAALYKVSRALGSSLDPDEVLDQVMDAVIRLTGAERGFILLFNEKTREPELVSERNIDSAKLDHEEMQFSHTVVNTVLTTGKGIVTVNAQEDVRFSKKDSITRFALRSILCEPLRSRGQTIGVIYVDNKIKSGVFQDDDREMLEALAAQAAIAIDNARLFAQIDADLANRIAELEMLQRIDRDLNVGLDFDQVMELTLAWALRGTSNGTGWIALLSESGEGMVKTTGDDQGSFLSFSDPPMSAFVEAGKQQVTHISNTGLTTLITPAVREAQVIAVICVERSNEEFLPEEKEFMERLANHAAVAIDNTRLYRAAQLADQAKSHFISIVSHELKTPMTSIRGYTDLIRQGAVGPTTPEQARFLDTIRVNVDRMADLVSDLADISRIETGRLKVQILPVTLSDSVQESLIGIHPQIEGKQQQIHIELSDGLPMVLADRIRLIQVLSNLLSNANKYTPEGGSISLHASTQGEFVRVSVQDTGIGMSPDDQARVFSQFFRSDEPEVRDEVGWGLGLYVTQRLVELMGGEIGVRSQLGSGSEFWFTLPVETSSTEIEG